MKAMILNKIGLLEENRSPLDAEEIPVPVPRGGEILLRVSACGVCHTELDEIEGRTPPVRLPMILGHQIIGRVVAAGEGAGKFQSGDRVGIGWIHSACGKCPFCRSGRENLCDAFEATGRDRAGGYAEYTTVPVDFAYPIPVCFTDVEAAPLLCAGAIGYRSLRLAGLRDGQNLGLTGFGASAHLVLKMALYRDPETRVFVFARNPKERIFARELGAVWAGHTDEKSPERMHAIIDTTPAWRPVTEALKNLAPGGRLVINAIRKEEDDKDNLLALDYAAQLWLEKEIKSVANVTRQDIVEFLQIAAQMNIRPQVQTYPLEEANRALCDLRDGKVRGAKVLIVNA
ncbi:MAG: zinc-dependent alcohol dehydrogenase family protein [Syntrophales bacterium]|jgi:propanol-preferring alcohol dehydrogenase|nr:zinc-dependent alcohol dehydrogenase family protein [Syntrophales bacterium]